jgi:CRP-like cAMP-binding protein
MQATTSSSSSISCQDEITFMYPGDYFGEERFLRGVERSTRTFVAVNEVTLCVISQALFDDHQTFGAVRAWMENDVSVRERVKSVRILRKQRSLMRGLGSEQRGSSLKSIWALADEGQDKPSSAVRKSTISSYGSSSSASSHLDDPDHDPISRHDATASCEPSAFDLMCCSPSHNAAPVPDPVHVSVPRT